MGDNKSGEINLDVKLEEKDLFWFNLKLAYGSMGVIWIGIVTLLGVLYIIDVAYKMAAMGYKPPLQAYVILVLTLVSLYTPVRIKRSVGKMMKTSRMFQQVHHYKINSREVSIRIEGAHTRVFWDKVINVREEKNYFAIYMTKAQAYIIPKRSFNNTEEMNRFRNVIKQSKPSVKNNLKAS